MSGLGEFKYSHSPGTQQEVIYQEHRRAMSEAGEFFSHVYENLKKDYPQHFTDEKYEVEFAGLRAVVASLFSQLEDSWEMRSNFHTWALIARGALLHCLKSIISDEFELDRTVNGIVLDAALYVGKYAGVASTRIPNKIAELKNAQNAALKGPKPKKKASK